MATYMHKVISLTLEENKLLEKLRGKGIKIIDIFRAGLKFYNK